MCFGQGRLHTTACPWTPKSLSCSSGVFYNKRTSHIFVRDPQGYSYICVCVPAVGGPSEKLRYPSLRITEDHPSFFCVTIKAIRPSALCLILSSMRSQESKGILQYTCVQSSCVTFNSKYSLHHHPEGWARFSSLFLKLYYPSI